MTAYRYMSTRSISGYTPVTLEYKSETPLGETYQYDTILVQAYSRQEAEQKAARYLRKNVAACINNVGEVEYSEGGYGTTTVEVHGNTYHIPEEVHSKIVEQAKVKWEEELNY